MIGKYLYWYFDGFFSNEVCDKIISLAKTKKTKKGSVNTGLEKPVKHLKTRNSNIVWLDEKWIYDLISPKIQQANINACWNHQFDFIESAQFTIYNKNQFYDWHIDAFPEPYKNKNENLNGKIRKLSCTLQLSNEFEYSGGELEFSDGNPKKQETIIAKEALKKGTLIVFPSYVYHRVKPVIKGTRKSLVLWSVGHPFI